MRFFVFILLSCGSVVLLPSRKPENVFSRGPLDYRTLLVDTEAAAVYVGARGKLFRLWAFNVNDTSDNLFTEKTLTVSDAELSECRSGGNTAEDCAPSVRTLFLRDQRENLLICSSVALKPEVRVVDAVRLEDRRDPETVIGLCAPDKEMNTTAVFVEWGNPKALASVYSGIRTGMAGENHLIYRPPLVDGTNEALPLMRTIYTDTNWLNEAQFVGSFDVGEYVFFFFREIAVESGVGERTVYSRVARVCKKDIGGKTALRQVWTSFVKARLNCSISAQYPFYFDHIQSVARVDSHGDTLFYAGMSTSDTAFTTSAICVFSLKTINHIFDHGLFAEVSSPSWQATGVDAVPSHRPGTCVEDSQSLDASSLHFIRSHLLMAEPVSGGRPIASRRDIVYHHIHVDPRGDSNVIFAVDAPSRRLLKVSHWKDGSEWSWFEHELVELATGGPVVDTGLFKDEFFYATSSSGVSQFTLADCSKISSCQLCAVDPYCSWDVERAHCIPRESEARRMHSRRVGSISSWPSRGANECKAITRPILRKVFPGDAVHLEAVHGAQWARDGVFIASDMRTLFTIDSGLVLLDVSKKDNGDYEAELNGQIVVRYRLIVDHEDCALPKTVESYKAAHREWCKAKEAHKKKESIWNAVVEKMPQCPVTQNVSSSNRLR